MSVLRGTFRAVFLFPALPILLLGCATNCDLVEAELRVKEKQLDELRAELDKHTVEVQALEAEVNTLTRRSFKSGAALPGSRVRVKQITLGRLTGGYDEDPKVPGDDKLQILLEPRDFDDQSVKVQGELQIDLLEVLTQGQKLPLSTWTLSPRQLRALWEDPLFGSPAYRVVLPWKEQPSSKNLRVVAKFTTQDGQIYEADKDITIRLPMTSRPPVIRTTPQPPRGPELLEMPTPIIQGPKLDTPKPHTSSKKSLKRSLPPPPPASRIRPIQFTTDVRLNIPEPPAARINSSGLMLHPPLNGK